MALIGQAGLEVLIVTFCAVHEWLVLEAGKMITTLLVPMCTFSAKIACCDITNSPGQKRSWKQTVSNTEYMHTSNWLSCTKGRACSILSNTGKVIGSLAFSLCGDAVTPFNVSFSRKLSLKCLAPLTLKWCLPPDI